MLIIDNVQQHVNPDFVKDQCLHSIYTLETTVENYVRSKLIDGTTVILFSGGFRLDFTGTYIEPKMFQSADLPWKSGTIFVDPGTQPLLEYTLKKLNITNLLVLNSAVFLQYRAWNKICQDINYFKNFSKQVIVSTPIDRIDFNRLKYSEQDIATRVNGVVVEKSIVICQ